MGRILKLVYSHPVELHGRTYHLSNGLPRLAVDYVKQCTVNEQSFNPVNNIIRIEQSNPQWRGHFTLNNFYYYFKKFYGEDNIVSIDDVVDDDNVVYAYPIEINTTVNALTDKHEVKFNGHNISYSVIDTFGDKVLDYMRRGKLKILISNIQDPCVHSSSIYEFEKVIKAHGISESNLICIFGNGYYRHQDLYPGSKTKFTYGILPLQQQALGALDFPRTTSMGYESDIVREKDIEKLKNTMRPKKFLSFNRSMRSHRYYLAYMAMKHNFLDQGIFSFINLPDSENSIRQSLNKFNGSEISDGDFKKLMSLFPIELDTQQLDSDQKRGFTTDSNKKDWYINSYIHLTSETSFDIDYTIDPFFSEKTFRPIINLQPFIFLGNTGSLKKLQELGFKTFHPVIDETYDTVLDPVERMKLIEIEIVKLANLPVDQLHSLYYQFTDILLHNYQTLLSYKDTNPFETAVRDIENYEY